MDINTAFPSRWLKASDIGDEDLSLTIVSVDEEDVGQGKTKEVKPVAFFSETDKGLILNKTNAKSIEQLYGPETDDWIGKTIRLFATDVEFQGDQVEAIRVRRHAPQARRASPPARGTTAPAGARFKDAGAFLTQVVAEFDLKPSEVTAILGVSGPKDIGDLDEAYERIKAHQADSPPFE